MISAGEAARLWEEKKVAWVMLQLEREICLRALKCETCASITYPMDHLMEARWKQFERLFRSKVTALGYDIDIQRGEETALIKVTWRQDPEDPTEAARRVLGCLND